MSLIIALGQLVDQSIKTGHGQLKSLVVSLLKPIEMYQIENNYFKGKTIMYYIYIITYYINIGGFFFFFLKLPDFCVIDIYYKH